MNSNLVKAVRFEKSKNEKGKVCTVHKGYCEKIPSEKDTNTNNRAGRPTEGISFIKQKSETERTKNS